MASFPGSVKSFTSKNTGDVVQASHINDLQDEVSAIEDGFRNATAPLNSSNSTVAKLSVTGLSTLGGAVTLGAGIASTTSFASSVTFAAGVSFNVAPVIAPEAALVFLDSTKTLGSSALSTVLFNADSFLTNSSLHSTGTNPERLTPQTTGFYYFSAQVDLAAATVQRRVRIQDSTGTVIAEQTCPASATSNDVRIQVGGYKRYDAIGGFATCVIVSTGSPSTFSISTGVGGTWFALERL